MGLGKAFTCNYAFADWAVLDLPLTLPPDLEDQTIDNR